MCLKRLTCCKQKSSRNSATWKWHLAAVSITLLTLVYSKNALYQQLELTVWLAPLHSVCKSFKASTKEQNMLPSPFPSAKLVNFKTPIRDDAEAFGLYVLSQPLYPNFLSPLKGK
jgi:hypothetical protein